MAHRALPPPADTLVLLAAGAVQLLAMSRPAPDAAVFDAPVLATLVAIAALAAKMGRARAGWARGETEGAPKWAHYVLLRGLYSSFAAIFAAAAALSAYETLR